MALNHGHLVFAPLVVAVGEAYRSREKHRPPHRSDD